MRVWLLVLLSAFPIFGQPVDLFLLIGQSNMAGRGAIEAQDRQVIPGVFALTQRKTWTPAVDPIHFDKPDRLGTGLGRTFAVTLIQNRAAAAIGLIPAAFGGSSLDEWAPGGMHYNNAVERYRAAVALSPKARLRGILWHQGEADASDARNALSYRARFTALVAALRKDLGDVPVVVGELGPFVTYPYAGTVNEQLELAALLIPNCAFASSRGLKHKGDEVHFDSASLREFGKRYAAAWLGLQRTAASNSKEPSFLP